MKTENFTEVRSQKWIDEKADKFIEMETGKETTRQLEGTDTEKLQILDNFEKFLNSEKISEDFSKYEFEPQSRGWSIWKK